MSSPKSEPLVEQTRKWIALPVALAMISVFPTVVALEIVHGILFTSTGALVSISTKAACFSLTLLGLLHFLPRHLIGESSKALKKLMPEAFKQRGRDSAKGRSNPVQPGLPAAPRADKPNIENPTNP